MTIEQIIIATTAWLTFTLIVYGHSGIKNVLRCYSLFFKKSYWTSYNIVEFISWITKIIIIVPGLIFHIQIWQLYFITLLSSLTLIWASNKKLLPTLVGFNTVWAWISCMILAQNLV
jgi:hypothetical protein